MIIYLGADSRQRSCDILLDHEDGPPICSQVLQQTGFTSLDSHLSRLWALTPLVSPLPPLITSDGLYLSFGNLRLHLCNRYHFSRLAAGASFDK